MSLSTQHLNLLDDKVRPPPQRYTAAQGLVATAIFALLLCLMGGGLRWASHTQQRRLDEARATLATLGAQLRAPGAFDALIAEQARQLRALREQGTGLQNLTQVLQAGSVGRSEGYAAYLQALWRHGGAGASPQLWLTGFKTDGKEMEISGRMLDAAALSPYLRQLNEEPLFQGHQFAQLSIVTPAKTEAGGPAFNEFLLTAHGGLTANGAETKQ